MNSSTVILIRSFVKPFYRENAGAFFFFVMVMFFSVGLLNGASIIQYHYSLIMGMLTSKQLFLIVCVAWLLYVRKCAAFVFRNLSDPQYGFLHLYNCIGKAKRFALLLLVQVLLFAPVLVYGCFIIGVAWHHHYYGAIIICSGYFLLLCIAPAALYMTELDYPRRIKIFSWQPLKGVALWTSSYLLVLLRFIMGGQKWLVMGIKLFTCCALYGMAANNTLTDYDTGFPFLFFNFGIIANGIIVYRARVFEETHLALYRGMPVSLLKRWLQYAIVYGLLLIPEWITIAALTPVHLHGIDAWRFALCAFSLLLLLNSISFLDDFSMKGYLRVLLVIICIEYFFVIADALTMLYLVLFVAGAGIFAGSYYTFERGRGQIGD